MRKFMQEAMRIAREGGKEGEVPVGAVVVKAGEIIAKAHNETIKLKDPTAHAEILAIRLAAGKLNSPNLSGCEIYCTVEPCPMCAGAILHSKIRKVVYALDEAQFGSFGTYINLANNPHFKDCEVYGGIMEEEARGLMQEFFKNLR